MVNRFLAAALILITGIGAAVSQSNIFTPVPHQWIAGFGANGRPIASQPTLSDIAGNEGNIYPQGLVYGVSQSGAVRTSNGTILQNANNSAKLINGTVVLPCQYIEYDVRTTSGGFNAGLLLPGGTNGQGAAGMRGCGSTATRLIQFAPNFPALTVGNLDNVNYIQGGTVSGFSVGFGVDQSANTQGIGVQIGGFIYSSLYDVRVDPFVDGGGRVEAYQGFVISNANGIGPFANQYGPLYIFTGAQNFIFSNGSTGDFWSYVYVGGSANQGVDFRTPASNAVVFNNCTAFGSIAKMDIEWIKSPTGTTSGILLFNNCRGGSIDQLRFEGDFLQGAGPNLIGATLSDVEIQSLNLYNINITATTGTAAILGVFGETHFKIDSGNWQWNTFGTGLGAATAAFQACNCGNSSSTDTARQRIEFGNIYMIGNASGTFSFDSSLSAATVQNVQQWGRYIWNPAISTVEDLKTFVVPATTAWTLYGWAVRPQVVVDFALAAGLTITWEDTWGAAGLPSQLPTYSPNMMQLQRTANATGAFNVLLKNHAAATITTQAAASTFNTITRNGTTLTNN